MTAPVQDIPPMSQAIAEDAQSLLGDGELAVLAAYTPVDPALTGGNVRVRVSVDPIEHSSGQQGISGVRAPGPGRKRRTYTLAVLAPLPDAVIADGAGVAGEAAVILRDGDTLVVPGWAVGDGGGDVTIRVSGMVQNMSGKWNAKGA